jgi:hypothetical protein
MAGGIAGIISWMPTYPFDTIKTRMQGDGFGKNQKFKSSLHCFRVTISGKEVYILIWFGLSSFNKKGHRFYTYLFYLVYVKGVFSKPSRNLIVAPRFCFLS